MDPARLHYALRITAAALQAVVQASKQGFIKINEGDTATITLGNGEVKQFTIGEILDLAAEALTPASVEHAESE